MGTKRPLRCGVNRALDDVSPEHRPKTEPWGTGMLRWYEGLLGVARGTDAGSGAGRGKWGYEGGEWRSYRCFDVGYRRREVK
jgi:hypothetical protein